MSPDSHDGGVSYTHILEDLRDAYSGPIEETILTEIVANALDSGARSLALDVQRDERTLIARDDGRGMTRRELSRYHDLGASTKRRDRGIGFAGVGIKLGLLACDEVVTETRRGQVHAATTWKLATRTRVPWSWIDPPHLLDGDGTAVLLRLESPLSLLLDPGFLETTVLRQFQPFFEPEFIDILAPSYPHGFSIFVNERVVVGPNRPAPRSAIQLRVGRQRKNSGIGYLSRHDGTLSEHERGLAISTLGEVSVRWAIWGRVSAAEHARGAHLRWTAAASLRRRRERHERNRPQLDRPPGGWCGPSERSGVRGHRECSTGGRRQHPMRTLGGGSDTGARGHPHCRDRRAPADSRAHSQAGHALAPNPRREAGGPTGSRAPRRVHRVGQ